MWQNWESCAKPVYSFPNYIVSQTPWAVDSIALKCVHAFPLIQKALSLPCIFNSNQPLSTGRILFKGPVSDTGALSWDRRHPNCYCTVTLKRECSRWVQRLPRACTVPHIPWTEGSWSQPAVSWNALRTDLSLWGCNSKQNKRRKLLKERGNALTRLSCISKAN